MRTGASRRDWGPFENNENGNSGVFDLYPYSCGGKLETAQLATGRTQEARTLAAERLGFCLDYPKSLAWIIPWAFVFENDPVSAVRSILEIYDVLSENGMDKIQDSRGHVMLSKVFVELGDTVSADYWLERALTTFGRDNPHALRSLRDRQILARDVESLTETIKELSKAPDLSGQGLEGVIIYLQAFTDLLSGDPSRMRELYNYSDSQMLPFVNIPTWLLTAALLKNEDDLERLGIDVPAFYAAGRGTWGIDPNPHDMPGERHKHYGLGLAAVLNNDWDQAFSQFDKAFNAGLRDMRLLEFYGLTNDKYGIYNGFTEDPRWHMWLDKVRKANARDLSEIRVEFPELFPEI